MRFPSQRMIIGEGSHILTSKNILVLRRLLSKWAKL